MARQEATTTDCLTCSTGKIFTGRWAVHNAKNQEGKSVCNDCKVHDIYSQYGLRKS